MTGMSEGSPAQSIGSKLATANAAVVRTYSRLPAAGRAEIRRKYISCKTAPTLQAMRVGYRQLRNAVYRMTISHAAYVAAGIYATVRHADQMIAAPSPANVTMSVFDGLYTAAAAGAIHTQFSVLGRARRNLHRRMNGDFQPIARADTPAGEIPRFTPTDWAITGAAQAAFAATFFL